MEINALTLLTFNETPKSLTKITADLGYKAYAIENDKILSLLDFDCFPMEVLIDVLLLKDIPDDFPYRIVKKDYPCYAAVVDWIADMIIDMDNWSYNEFYILYVLKDFPSIYNNEKIYKLLKNGLNINKLNEYPSISFVADWASELP